MSQDTSVGELLLAHQLITRSQLEECLIAQKKQPHTALIDIVLARQLCTRDAAMQALSKYVQSETDILDPQASLEIYEESAERTHRNTGELAGVTDLLAQRLKAPAPPKSGS